MVPPCSDRISRVPPYLIRLIMLHIRDCHPLWLVFPDHSIHIHSSAGPRSLAATRGVSVDFLSSGYLDVSVPRVCLFNLCIQLKIPINWWVSPFGNPWIKASLQANHGLSHVTTSFIASDCQGIHRIRLVA